MKIKLNEQLKTLEGIRDDFKESIKAYAVLYKTICEKSKGDYEHWTGNSHVPLIKEYEQRVEEYKAQALTEQEEDEVPDAQE